MKKLVIFFTLVIAVIFSSCATAKKDDLCFSEQSVVLEATKQGRGFSDIRIVRRFGETRNVFTGEPYFCDHVAYPYYSIRKFCSALDGEVTEMRGFGDNKSDASVTVKTGNLEIEYFGYFRFSENLNVGDKIKKGTCLGIMFGGGETGMVLHLRTRYNGRLVDPEQFFLK